MIKRWKARRAAKAAMLSQFDATMAALAPALR